MKYTESYCLCAHDADWRGVASPSAFMRYMQETAYRQHRDYGPTIAEMRQKGMGFMLSRVAVDICEEIAIHERFTVTTWLAPLRGVSLTRYSVFTKENGREAARIAGFWGLFDLRERKALRSTAIPMGFDADADTVDVESPLRFSAPSRSSCRTVGAYSVGYHDCDENFHMNNTHYPDIFADYLEDIRERRIGGFSISYRAEHKAGDSFQIVGGRDEAGRAYFASVFPDGTIGAEVLFR